MTEGTKNCLEEIIKLHGKGIKEIGVTADKATTLVDNMAKLYRLGQKDDEIEQKNEELKLKHEELEMKHDVDKEKLAYDNGRADLELRAKEHQIATDSEKLELDRARLDFEREKFQCELAVKEEANQIERAKIRQGKVGQCLQAAIAASSTLFNGWLSRTVLTFEKEGVVGSFTGKRVLSSMLGKQKVE